MSKFFILSARTAETENRYFEFVRIRRIDVESNMKVIIHDLSQSRYLNEKNRWTKSESKARNFSSSLQAIDYCFQRHIRGAEIVLTFPDPRYDIHLDVFPRGCRKDGAG